MFNPLDFDLSRQKYYEFHAQYDGLYVPFHAKQPGFIHRLLTILRNLIVGRTPEAVEYNHTQDDRAGSWVKQA